MSTIDLVDSIRDERGCEGRLIFSDAYAFKKSRRLISFGICFNSM